MKLGVMGCGHLGQAFVKGLLYRQIAAPQEIFVTAKSPETKSRLASDYGVHVCQTNRDLLLKSDIIFITMPPSIFLRDSDTMQEAAKGKTIISFMAGIPIATLQAHLKGGVISRAMPTISIEKGSGIIGYTKTAPHIAAIFEKLGYAFLATEADIEKVTAFAACGYGFAARILSAFEKAGETLGFDKEISRQMTSCLFSVAALEKDFEGTAAAVATPGGATEQGLHLLERFQMDYMVEQAIKAAYLAVRPD